MPALCISTAKLITVFVTELSLIEACLLLRSPILIPPAMYGNFVKLCQEVAIKPIADAEIRNEDKLLYILIPANNDGLTQIQEFLSVHLMAKKTFPEPTENPFQFKNDCDGFIIYPLDSKPLNELASNEMIGVLS